MQYHELTDAADELGLEEPRGDEPGNDQREELSMEPQVPHVYVAITAIRAKLAKLGLAKDRVNEFQKFNFRGIDDVYNVTSALLAEHGVCIMPNYSEREQVERVDSKGKPLFWVTLRGAFAFVSAVDGSEHTVVTYGEAFDMADKATNKAMAAAMKYAMLQTFTVPTKGDNDADASSHEVAAYTKDEQDTLAALHTAAAGGLKSLKAAWQALPMPVRDRLRRELQTLSELAEKNNPKPANEPAAEAA